MIPHLLTSGKYSSLANRCEYSEYLRIGNSTSLQLQQSTALTGTLGVQTTGSGQSTQTQGTAHGFQLTWPNISICWCAKLQFYGKNEWTWWWTTCYSFFWAAIFSDKPISSNSVWISQRPFPASISAGCFQGVCSSLAKLSENSGSWKSLSYKCWTPHRHDAMSWSHIMSSQNLTDTLQRKITKDKRNLRGATQSQPRNMKSLRAAAKMMTSWPAFFNLMDLQAEGSSPTPWRSCIMTQYGNRILRHTSDLISFTSLIFFNHLYTKWPHGVSMLTCWNHQIWSDLIM